MVLAVSLLPDWESWGTATGGATAQAVARIVLVVLAAGVAGLLGAPVLRRLPVPAEDDGAPAADYRLLASWRVLPAVLATVTAALAAGVVCSLPWPLVPASLAVVMVAPLLGYVDLRTHLLPDPLTLAATVVATAALVACCVAAGRPGALLLALACAVGCGLAFLVLALLGAGIGLGDVKLVVVLAGTAGVLGVGSVLLMLVASVVIGGAVALALVVRGRLGRRDPVAFGPCLLLGWWVAVLWSGLALVTVT